MDYHSNCTNGDPNQPNSIGVWNSLDEVLSVGAVDDNNDVWDYSSRGPGQWAHLDRPNPDCVAPTYGEVMWGRGYKHMVNGWDTSGAAPLVSGLAALLASQNPASTRTLLIDRILTCNRHSAPAVCCGHGVINCGNAIY